MRTAQHTHMVKNTGTLVTQCLYFGCSISLFMCAYFLALQVKKYNFFIFFTSNYQL